MKRILSMLLVCLLLAGSASALAEEKVVYSGLLTRMSDTEEEWNLSRESMKPSKSETESEGKPDKKPDSKPDKKLSDESTTVYVFFDDLVSALLALDAGRIDKLSLTRCIADYIIAQNPGKYTAEESSARHAYSMLMRDTDAEFMERLNEAISQLDSSGKMEALQGTYLDTELPSENLELPVIEGAPTYRVLVTGDLPPMDYVSVDGQADGFNVALLAALSDILDVNFEIVAASSGARAIMLMSGKVDIVFWTQSHILERGSEEHTTTDIPDGCVVSEVYLIQQKVYLRRAE